jgi:hypothetical protein
VGFDLRPILDGAIDAPHPDYDETATLAWTLCPSVGATAGVLSEATSRGLRLRSPGGGTPLRCPSALAQSADSALALNRMTGFLFGCPPGQNCRSLEADVAAVVDLLLDPALYAAPANVVVPPVRTVSQVAGEIPHRCALGQEQLLSSAPMTLDLNQDRPPAGGP